MSAVVTTDAKAFATLQAKAALNGWQVVAMPGGGYVVARWGLTRALANFGELERFLKHVGAIA